MLSPYDSSSERTAPIDAAAVLAAAGRRPTPQRLAVYEHLSRVTTHPTAEQIHQAVRETSPNISLATVYKTLETLVEAGLVTKLSGADGSAHYDAHGEQHYHVRDVSTGALADLDAPYDPALLDKIDPTLRDRLAAEGLEISGYRLEVLVRPAGDGASDSKPSEPSR